MLQTQVVKMQIPASFPDLCLSIPSSQRGFIQVKLSKQFQVVKGGPNQSIPLDFFRRLILVGVSRSYQSSLSRNRLNQHTSCVTSALMAVFPRQRAMHNKDMHGMNCDNIFLLHIQVVKMQIPAAVVDL